MAKNRRPTRWAKRVEVGGYSATKGCYHTNNKLFTSNFIRQIYQNLIYHDLSSIHIYSWNWPRKKCATLILLQKLHRHFPYVPQVLCTEESRLEPGSVGRFSNCQLPTRQAVGNPASGFGGKAAILIQRNTHQGNRWDSKRQKAKVLHQRPQASKDHISDIWVDFTKKNALAVGLMYFWFMLIYIWSTYGWFTLIADASVKCHVECCGPNHGGWKALSMRRPKWAASKPRLRNLFRGNPC